MKRMFLAALVGTTALAPAALMAQTNQQGQNQQNQQMQMQAQSGQQQQGQAGQARVTAQQMRGQPVMGSQGNRIGTVQQIVIGRSGQSYAVVQVEGGQNRLLPTQAIVLREGRLYVQNMTRDQVTQLRSAAQQEQGEFQEAEMDQVLVVAMEAEMQGGQQTQQRQQTAEVEAEGADIVVEQTSPRLRISQPEPEVLVNPAEPEVTVRQMNPQILVRQAPPRVTIEQPQPEIIVRMPEPQVNVAQGQPQVQVRQGQPQVQIQQPEQQAAVQVEQGQARVQIQDDQEQAQVSLQRGQPEVRFERTGEPEVVFQQAQGQPTVRYERMETEQAQAQQQERQQTAQVQQSEQEVIVETEERNAQMREMLIDENATEQTGSVNAQTQPVAISELEGQTVSNFRGQELGDVERVVATPDGEFLVVIGAGGFLGLGEDTVAIPLQRLSMRGDELLVRGVTEQDIENMQDYEERYPNARRLGAADEVDVGIYE